MTQKSLNILPANTEDFRRMAKKRLPLQFFDYIDGGSYNERTIKDNTLAFDRLQLRQRVLKDVSKIDTSTSILGQKLSMPLILAPVGLAGAYASRGEVQALRAANQAGIPFSLSTVSICSIEEVSHASTSPFWFQLYVLRDHAYAKRLLERAQQAGCETLIFTVDLAVVGARYRDTRNGLNGVPGVINKIKYAWDIASHPGWVWDVALKGRPLVFGNLTEAVPDAKDPGGFRSWIGQQLDASVTWEDLKWIRDHWQGKIVIKGILDVEDAQQAKSIGADGIVVSNHGGRQLDGVPATLTVLEDIVKAVGTDITVIVDGGVTSGLDVVKALALGADACMIGKAWAFALAAQGEQGVSNLLATFNNEMKVAMALTGKAKIGDINRSILY